MEIIVYICTARGLEVKSCEDADNNIVMRRRTQQPGIYWPSDAGPGPRLGVSQEQWQHAAFIVYTLQNCRLQCLLSTVHCPLSTVHCTEGTEKRDVSMMLREGVEVERVEVLSDGGADGGGQR